MAFNGISGTGASPQSIKKFLDGVTPFGKGVNPGLENLSRNSGPVLAVGGDTSIPGSSLRNPDGSLKNDTSGSGGGGLIPFSGPYQTGGGFGAQDAIDLQGFYSKQQQGITDRALAAEGTANVKFGGILAKTLDKYRNIFGSYLKYGPSQEFVTDAAKRLQQLENDPNSYLDNDKAFGQFRGAMSQELERALIAQGHNPGESGFGAASQQEAMSRVRLDYLNSLRDTFLKEMQASNPLQITSLQSLNNLMGYDINNNPGASTLAGLAQLGQINNSVKGDRAFGGVRGDLAGTGVTLQDLLQFQAMQQDSRVNMGAYQLPSTVAAYNNGTLGGRTLASSA